MLSLKRSLNRTRKRLPVFSLMLLGLLLGINIISSVYMHVASAQSSQTTRQANAQIEHATISPVLNQGIPTPGHAQGEKDCPQVPAGQVLKLENIIENIIYAVDPVKLSSLFR